MARHRTRLAGMVGVTATATCTAHRGVVEASGQLLNAAALAQRVGWMSAIVRDMTRRLLDAHWTTSTFAALAAGVDAGGATLPGPRRETARPPRPGAHPPARPAPPAPAHQEPARARRPA